MVWRSRRYRAEPSAQTTSSSTRCDIQNPAAECFSAIFVCLGSSLRMSRSTTLVSAARMLLPDVIADRSINLLDGGSRRWPSGEEPLADLGPGRATSASNDDLALPLIPFDDRAGFQPELLTYLDRHRDLTLGREPRPRDGHEQTIARARFTA